MKKYFITLIVFLVIGTFITPGLASFKLPYLVYRMDQLNEAKEMAREEGIPITFIYTDESTKCGLCTAASLDVVDELKDHTVIIYIDSKDDTDWVKTPKIVKRAIKSLQAGKFIPKTVIVDPDIKRVYSIIPYVRDINKRKYNLHRARSTFSD